MTQSRLHQSSHRNTHTTFLLNMLNFLFFFFFFLICAAGSLTWSLPLWTFKSKHQPAQQAFVTPHLLKWVIVCVSVCALCLQSFLIVRDSVTSQPSLLCVSVGGDNEAVLDYNIKSTDTGMDRPHANTVFSICVCVCVYVCLCICLCLHALVHKFPMRRFKWLFYGCLLLLNVPDWYC